MPNKQRTLAKHLACITFIALKDEKSEYDTFTKGDAEENAIMFEEELNKIAGNVPRCDDCGTHILEHETRYPENSDQIYCETCFGGIRTCHLCGNVEENKYCTNESCYEFTKHE